MFPSLLLLVVTATFRPSKPTVGDLITVDLGRPVTLDRSADFEVVRRQGSSVVIRTFQAKPLVISGTAGTERFRIEVPVRSVLVPRDTMKPAPLRPPRPLPLPRAPLIAIAAAALMAMAAWAAALWLDRRAATRESASLLSPAERFRASVASMRKRPPRQRWAQLADATRAYLASREFGPELTTEQLLARVAGQPVAGRTLAPPGPGARPGGPGESQPTALEIVAAILHQGDLEKFSPWGAPSGDFDALAACALLLPEVFEPPPVLTEAAA